MSQDGLQTQIKSFIAKAGLKKKEFTELFGMKYDTQLYQLSDTQDYHLNHFSLLVHEQERTGLTGQEFINHIRFIHRKIR